MGDEPQEALPHQPCPPLPERRAGRPVQPEQAQHPLAEQVAYPGTCKEVGRWGCVGGR